MTTQPLSVEFRYVAPVVTTARAMPAPESATAAVPAYAGGPLTAQEVQQLRALVADSPSVREALMKGLETITNPNEFGMAAREFSAMAAQLRTDPRQQISSHPALQTALREVQQAELSKPGPLNTSHGESQVVPAPALAVADLSTASITDQRQQGQNVEAKRQRDVQEEEWRNRNSWRVNPGASGGLPTSFGNVETTHAALSNHIPEAKLGHFETPNVPDVRSKAIGAEINGRFA